MTGSLPNKDLFTVKETAQYFCVGTSTLYRWIREDRIKAVELPSGALRIKKEAIKTAEKPKAY